MPSHLRRYDEPGDAHFWTVSTFRRLGFFHDDGVKRVLVDGLCSLHVQHDICLIGYVIMPEHVHILLYPHARGVDQPTPISALLEQFKTQTGRDAKQRHREVWRERGRLWAEPLNHWARGEFGAQRPIWNVRGHDFNIRNYRTLLTKLDYCHKNPVTRGLVDHPGQWPWSSYRFYEFDDHSALEMNWNGRWPIIW